MAIVDEGAATELQLAFMLWRRFRNAKDQIRLLEDFVKSAGGKLTVSAPPVVAANECFSLLQDGGSNILYFYTHGFTRRREASLSVTEELDRFRRHYERLPDGDPRRATLEPIYEALAEGTATDRSYIELSYGKVFLDDLYHYIDELPARPFVLLNMCESAQVSPSLSDSFVHFFLNRGAPSVVGTECPMTVTFAHPFSEALLTRVLGGESVGEAMLGARRRFLQDGNPLGLAYTLYGSAETYFRPPCLPASGATTT